MSAANLNSIKPKKLPHLETYVGEGNIALGIRDAGYACAFEEKRVQKDVKNGVFIVASKITGKVQYQAGGAIRSTQPDIFNNDDELILSKSMIDPDWLDADISRSLYNRRIGRERLHDAAMLGVATRNENARKALKR